MPVERDLHVAYKAVLLAFGLVVAALLFRQLVTLFLAVLLTVLLAIPLSAAATRLERWRIPRPLGVAIALIAGIAVLAGILALVIPPLFDQIQKFVDQVPSIVSDLEAKVGDVTGANQGEVGDHVQEFLQRYTNDPAQLIGPVASVGLSVAGILGALLIIVVTAAYMAARPEPLVNGLATLFPPRQRGQVHATMERLREAWIGWMQGVGVDMVITGVLLYIGLTLIGLDFAIVFAVFSALCVLVPYFGSIAGAIPPVLFALAHSPGKALLALVVYVLVQQIESTFTIPLVMANRVRIHPAIVAIGVVLVGLLFGFLGLFVAVPILAAIVILVDEIWVKPMERRSGLAPAGEAEVATEREREGPRGSEPAPEIEVVGAKAGG